MKRMSVALLFFLIGACSGERTQSNDSPAPGPAVAGNVETGRKLIDQYACVACHLIPGAAEGGGSMGPSLENIASRPTISGRVPNDPTTMAAYLQNPSAVDPQTRMPAVGLSEEEAQHVTAYLFTLK